MLTRSARASRFGPTRRRAASLLLAALAAGLAVTLPGALAGAAAEGVLAQLPGTSGCVSETGTGGACTDGKALNYAFKVSISGDGKSVYVASYDGDSVATFARNAATGALIQLASTAGCVSETGAGPCADGKALDAPLALTVSPDGKNVYVASSLSDAVAVFARTSTGKLGQLPGTEGCVSDTGAGPCADGKALNGARSVAVSPDGAHVYVASQESDAVAIFIRNTRTGKLSQTVGATAATGCVSETGAGPCADGKALDGAAGVAVSPDGKHVYVASSLSDAIAVFARNAITGSLSQLAGTDGCVSETGAGPCADGKALDGARELTVSADGKSVYLVAAGGSSNGVLAVFKRNTLTGTLMQPAGTDGCAHDTGSLGCADGVALEGVNSVAVTADGKTAYVGAWGVAVFARDTTTGTLSQLPVPEGCISTGGGTSNSFGGSGSCLTTHGIFARRGVAVSPDGKSVYAATPNFHGVSVFKRA